MTYHHTLILGHRGATVVMDVNPRFLIVRDGGSVIVAADDVTDVAVTATDAVFARVGSAVHVDGIASTLFSEVPA